MLFALIFYCINFLFGSQAAKDANWLLGIVAIMQIITQFIIRLGYFKTATFFLLTICWIAITAISQTVGGIKDEAVYGYVLIIIGSGYLLGWKISIAYTMSCIASLWWLAYLETKKIILPDVDGPYNTAIDLTFIFILILFVVYFLVQTLSKALEHSQNELSERIRAEKEREEAISEIQMLRGIIPICCSCKQIRNDKGYFETVEGYISRHSNADFSHTICDDCSKKLYPDFYEEDSAD